MTEIDVLKNLNHQNIVKFLGHSKTKDTLNIMLEFVEGGSIQHL